MGLDYSFEFITQTENTLKLVRNRHKINWRFIVSEFLMGEHAGSPFIHLENKTGSYFVIIP